MKVVQFGLAYSPNLGDGVIAECLAHAVAARRPGAEVAAVDMSGRQGFGAVTVRNRELAMKVLSMLPLALRQRVVAAKLGRMLDAVEPQWRAAAEGADLAVIGGGQIFSDADLNFCLKVARAAQVARGTGVPTAVYAAGVSHNWTARGAALFAELFAGDLRFVGLRDAPSMEAWQAQTGGRGPAPVLTRDPGLLAAACYGPARGEGARIGLGITAPAVLGYHADATVAGGGGDVLGFYARLAKELVARGHEVTLFCNGAEEDRAAIDRLARAPELAGPIGEGRVSCAPDPTRPAELARRVAGFRAVIAHRLHALILAYAYGRPVVGLGWDRKVESFLSSVGAERFFSGRPDASAAEVADMAEAALAAGIDPARHAQVLGETWDGIERLLAAVSLPPGGS